MKKQNLIPILTCAALLGGGASLTNAEDKGRPKGKGDGSFLKAMDKDGDNAISKEEAGERWERLGKLDKDGDGKVTIREMMAARGNGPGGPGKGGPKGNPGEMFKRSDKNNDGKITKDEVPERAWEFLSKLDKNGDDAVSEEEAKAGRPPGGPGAPGGPEDGRPDPSEMFKRADKNNDGKISKDEVPEQAWERLGKLDKDGDDAVSREEIKAMAAAKGKGGKGGPPPGGSGAMFDRFDKDSDGKLSEQEVPAEMWAKVRRADTDADGLVSKAELEKVMSMRDGKKPEGDRPDARKKKRPALEGDNKSA